MGRGGGEGLSSSQVSVLHDEEDHSRWTRARGSARFTRDATHPDAAAGKRGEPPGVGQAFSDATYEEMEARALKAANAACYRAQQIVHTMFPSVSGRTKDYISNPKPNGYPLHSTIKVAFDKGVSRSRRRCRETRNERRDSDSNGSHASRRGSGWLRTRRQGRRLEGGHLLLHLLAPSSPTPRTMPRKKSLAHSRKPIYVNVVVTTIDCSTPSILTATVGSRSPSCDVCWRRRRRRERRLARGSASVDDDPRRRSRWYHRCGRVRQV